MSCEADARSIVELSGELNCAVLYKKKKICFCLI